MNQPATALQWPTARTMLEELTRDYTGGQIEIVGFPAGRGVPVGPRHFPVADLDAMLAHAARLNARRGTNVYVSPARREGAPGNGRASSGDVAGTRWVWLDYDGPGAAERGLAELQALGFEPALIVTTGRVPHLRQQMHIRLSEEIAPGRARALMAAMKNHLGADSVQNPDRVMRLAGSIAWAKPDKPGRIDEVVTLSSGDNPIGYHPSELEEAFLTRQSEAPRRDAVGQDARHSDWREAYRRLPAGLQTAIAVGRADDRSADFQGIVNSLSRLVDITTALRILEAHPLGPAGKYRGRLEAELRRSWDKAATNGHQGGAPVTQQRPARESRFYSAATLKGKPVPARQWLVPDLVPQKTVTLFSGDGGTGKSLLALQLSVAVATDTDWLGKRVRAGRVIFLSAEDDEDELHRRSSDILRALGRDYDDLAGLTLRSVAGEDALLAIDNQIALTQSELFRELDARAGTDGPALIVIDTLADVFPANENDRAKVRQFVGILRGLALKRNCAVMLLGHPSLTGMANGTGTSGSTAWNNSVRSRLYLERIVDMTDRKTFEPNPDARRLTTMKANYGRTGGEIGLTWREGVFVADRPEGTLDRKAGAAKAERVFLELLRQFTEEGRNVNHASGRYYAPKAFAEHPGGEGVTKRAFTAAMNALFAAKRIRVERYGPASRGTTRIVMAQTD